MRIPLTAGAWLDHDPAWLAPAEADRTLAALRDELAWEQREIVLFGRRVLQPRLIAWAGDLGYRYSGQTLEPRPFMPAAARLAARVGAHTGFLGVRCERCGDTTGVGFPCKGRGLCPA